MYKLSSKDTFINCWHLSEHENLAMWKLYSKDRKGIVIQTNIRNFKNAFQHCDRDIFAGQIDYIDYENEKFYGKSSHKYSIMNVFSLFIHKRKIYTFENEYRAICTDSDGSKHKGINIKIDLAKIIQKIYLSPFATGNDYLEIKNKITELVFKIFDF